MRILIIVFISIIVLFLSVYAYFGGFRTVEFEERNTGGEIFVYEKVTGNYKQSPVVMDSIYYALLNDFGIETTKAVGVYYDNPQHVEEAKLRSEIGCLLDTPVDSILIAKLSDRFKVKALPEGRYVIGEFPNKGSLSVIVGILNVYPALDKFINERRYKVNGPITEIYDVPSKKIIYRQKMMADQPSIDE